MKKRVQGGVLSRTMIRECILKGNLYDVFAW
jgi:hypothetical protein